MGLIAGILNLLIAGLGYMTQGKIAKGVGTLIVCILFAVSLYGIPIALLIMLGTAYDAYKN